MEPTTIFFGVLLLTFLLLLTVGAYVLYSGIFHSVEVGAGKPLIKNIDIAYKFGRGPYNDTGYVFTEVTSIVPKQRCIGIYYDDPKQVAAHRLRWAVGCILSEGDETADPQMVANLEKKGFSIFRLPQVSNVVRTTFPKNTDLSVLIGIFKVYPLLGEYVRVNKLCAHPWMEVYDGRTIYYMAPLAKQDEFYVPESLDENFGLDEEEEEEETGQLMETVDEESEPCADDPVHEEDPQSEAGGDIEEEAKEEEACVDENTTVKSTVGGQGDSVTENMPVLTNDAKVKATPQAGNGDGADGCTGQTGDRLTQTEPTAPQTNGHTEIPSPEASVQDGVLQDGGVSSSTPMETEAPLSPAASEATSESASFNTSQSERSQTSQSQSDWSQSSYSSYEPSTATEFSSDSEPETETEIFPHKVEERVS